MTKKTWIQLLMVFSALAIFLGSSVAFAGDCKNVKFKFTNSTGAKIKVLKIEVTGNDGSWNENIGDEQIETQKSYTTGTRNMNKLDSGKKGDFKVIYKRWNAPNNEWRNADQKFSDQSCQDGKTFNFNLTDNN